MGFNMWSYFNEMLHRILKRIGVFLLFQVILIILPKQVHSQQTLESWIYATSMTSSIASNYSFVYNNYIYSLGGATSTVPSIGIRSTISADGTLSDWNNMSAVPSGRYWHAGSNNGNDVYLLGGVNTSWNNINSVILGSVEVNGDILSWQDITPLPQALSFGSSIIVGDKLYYAGGNIIRSDTTNSSTNQNIYMATINPADGTIGSWSDAGDLPSRMIGFGMLEINGYLYIFGGMTYPGSDTTVNVKRALINPGGTISPSWEDMISLPLKMYRFGITRSGNTIIIAGGRQSAVGSGLPFVYTSTINESGDISE